MNTHIWTSLTGHLGLSMNAANSHVALVTSGGTL